MALPINDLTSEFGVYIPEKYRPTLEQIIRNICENLRGYGENRTVLPIGNIEADRIPFEEYINLTWSLDYLSEEDVIKYVESDDEYSIEVINRYKLEQLNIHESGKKSDVPNLVYYNTNTGEGFVNGNHVKLKGRSKKSLTYYSMLHLNL